MAFVSNNNAYDISLFETALPDEEYSPRGANVKRKKAKVVRLPQSKIEQIRRRRHNPFKLAVGFALSAVIVSVIAVIIYGQVQLTELNQQIAVAQESLKNKQSEYTQMKMNVDAKYTTAIVEDYAKNKLGMSKASNNQKEFVDLSDGDKAEITANSEDSIFDKIADAISSLWS